MGIGGGTEGGADWGTALSGASGVAGGRTGRGAGGDTQDPSESGEGSATAGGDVAGSGTSSTGEASALRGIGIPPAASLCWLKAAAAEKALDGGTSAMDARSGQGASGDLKGAPSKGYAHPA